MFKIGKTHVHIKCIIKYKITLKLKNDIEAGTHNV